VLGGTLVASGKNLEASRDVIMDYGAVCATSFLFFLLILRFSRIHRISGIAFIVFYTGYMVARILLR
jgi:Ca2+/Na+ antiporter